MAIVSEIRRVSTAFLGGALPGCVGTPRVRLGRVVVDGPQWFCALLKASWGPRGGLTIEKDIVRFQ